jgi:hypothetical protein
MYDMFVAPKFEAARPSLPLAGAAWLARGGPQAVAARYPRSLGPGTAAPCGAHAGRLAAPALPPAAAGRTGWREDDLGDRPYLLTVVGPATEMDEDASDPRPIRLREIGFGQIVICYMLQKGAYFVGRVTVPFFLFFL